MKWLRLSLSLTSSRVTVALTKITEVNREKEDRKRKRKKEQWPLQVHDAAFNTQNTHQYRIWFFCSPLLGLVTLWIELHRTVLCVFFYCFFSLSLCFISFIMELTEKYRHCYHNIWLLQCALDANVSLHFIDLFPPYRAIHCFVVVICCW